MRIRFTIFLLTFVFVSFELSAQISPALSAALQNELNSLRISNKLKGISAAVRIPRKGTWKGASGVSHGSVPIDTSMLFNIGSVTKTFVAAETMKLVEEGKLSLEDTIGNLTQAHRNIKHGITVRMLLNHTAGLGDVTNQKMNDATFANLNKRWDPQVVVDSFLSPPVAEPGQIHRYSNAGYILLGLIAEKIEQDSLHKIIKRRFSNPYKLNRTFMHMYDPYTYKIPHNWSTPTMDPAKAQDVSMYPHPALYTTTAAAGGLFSTPADLTEWGYNLYTGEVIDTSSIREMTKFKQVAGGYFTGYGLGCMRFQKSNEYYIGHAGNFFGYAASMLFHPEDSICVGMLINQDCISPNIAMPWFYSLLNNMTVSLNEIVSDAAKGVLVYPNPANGKIFIESAEAIKEVVLTDLTGRMVLKEVATELNISAIPAGIYIANVETLSGKTFQKKIMITN